MEWDLLRAGVSWGASTDTAWKTETKGTFNQEPLRYKLERQKFQTVDSLCKHTALHGPSGLQSGPQVVVRAYWLISSLFSHAPTTQLPADSETEISSMEATIWPLLHHCTWTVWWMISPTKVSWMKERLLLGISLLNSSVFLVVV